MREIWEQRDPTFHQAELECLGREQREIVTVDDSVKDSPIIFEEEEKLPIVEEDEDSIESRDMSASVPAHSVVRHSSQQLGLSKEAIIRNEDAITLLYGAPPPISAQQALLGTPRWTSDYGCSECYVEGVRLERRAWIAGNEEDTRQRSRESYEVGGELGQCGIMKKTATMRMILPCDFIGDALHVCSEGVIREGCEKLEDCLLSVSSHAYANSLILSIEDMQSHGVGGVVFPLTAAARMIACPTAATALWDYWLCLKIISRSRTMTARDIGIAKTVAKDTRNLDKKPAFHIYDEMPRFGVDVLGFGRRELENGATNLQESTFFMELGGTDAERKKALSEL
ncbi:unnamed protein product [Cylicocyclus nassatus]|uniref:Uncharacterized protein n=1 Tax=Cylicocyclus nassatus TaxID=53992 RepID=A0AA36GK77_CYLNA|nr:unnamed protein product [Cylicocyclus nassatus]